MTPEQLAKAARLLIQPASNTAASISLSFGLASHAIGIWTGMATSAVQASQRLFAPAGQPLKPELKPVELKQGAAPVTLTVLEGGGAERAAQPVERAAPTGAARPEVGAQDRTPGKPPAKAVQNAANSAAALGDPEFGKEFARKAEAKTVGPVRARKPKPQPVHVPKPSANGNAKLKAAGATEAEARRPPANSPAPIQQARQPKMSDRPDTPDDLKVISGIGPKLEKVLNGLGIWTYAQLAALAEDEIAWLEDHLGFSGRIGRDDWLGQAKALATKH